MRRSLTGSTHAGSSRRNPALPNVSKQARSESRLRATKSPEDAVLNSDAEHRHCADTEQCARWVFAEYVTRVCEQIGAALRRKKDEQAPSLLRHRATRCERKQPSFRLWKRLLDAVWVMDSVTVQSAVHRARRSRQRHGDALLCLDR